MVANTVRYWRKRLDIRQLELVSMTGISTSTLNATERYGYLPGEDVRQRLARALGISEDKLWPNLVSNTNVKVN